MCNKQQIKKWKKWSWKTRNSRAGSENGWLNVSFLLPVVSPSDDCRSLSRCVRARAHAANMWSNSLGSCLTVSFVVISTLFFFFHFTIELDILFRGNSDRSFCVFCCFNSTWLKSDRTWPKDSLSLGLTLFTLNWMSIDWKRWKLIEIIIQWGY